MSTPAWFVLGAGLFDAAGALGFDLPIPNDALLLDRPLWFHGVGGSVAPLQAAPPIGGYVR